MTDKSVNKARRLGRPRKDLRRDSRALILDAALELFSTVGYEASTMKEIADRVGLRDSALYGHFRSKADLRDQLIKKHGPHMVRAELDHLDLKEAAVDPKDFLKNLMRRLADRWVSADESRFFRFMLMENLRLDTDPAIQINRLTEPLRLRLEGLARFLIANGTVRAVDPVWLVGQFIAPINAVRTNVAFSKEAPDAANTYAQLERHIDEFFSVFVIEPSGI